MMSDPWSSMLDSVHAALHTSAEGYAHQFGPFQPCASLTNPSCGSWMDFPNQSHELQSHEFHSEFSLIQQPETRKNRSKYRITAEMWRITSAWITSIGAGLSSFKAYPEMKRSNSSYLRLGWRVPSSWKLPWMFLPHWRGGFPRPMRNSRALRVKCGIGRPGEGIPFCGSHVSPERLWSTWKPQTTMYKWLFQLDDFKPLHRKWLFHQTSNLNWFFGVSGTTLPPIINGKVHHPTPAEKQYAPKSLPRMARYAK